MQNTNMDIKNANYEFYKLKKDRHFTYPFFAGDP